MLARLSIPFHRLSTVAVLLGCVWASSSVVAFNTVIDSVLGPEEDAYASGRIVDASGNDMATWMLSSSVSSTDFENDGITGGVSGIQYVMLNEVKGSTDVNQIRFAVAPNSRSFLQGLQISQSPYESFDGSWNGANLEVARFRVSWPGDALARVTDPDDQLVGVTTGSAFVSGTTLTFSSFIHNDVDSWMLELPAGVSEIDLEWSSSAPVADSDLTREWVTFRPLVVAVPEPSSVTPSFVFTAILLIAARRQCISSRRRR